MLKYVYEKIGILSASHAYRENSNISRTKSQNLNVSRLVLPLSVPNPLKPDVKSRMNMYLEQRRLPHNIWVMKKLIAY